MPCPLQTLPHSDVKVFQDYVLPSMSLIPNDPEEAVRAEYGMGLAHLAAAAHRWAAGQACCAHGLCHASCYIAVACDAFMACT